MDGSTIDRKGRLREAFISALHHLDVEQREPDRWEEECLSYALGALACGLYLVAEVELEAFWRPLDQRTADAVGALADKPVRFTKDMLRHGLDYVQQLYGCVSVVDGGMPPALVAGQRAVQASIGR